MIKRVVPVIKDEFFDSLKGFIEQYDFSYHGILEELEIKIKELVGRKHALAVNSGTNGIFMALHLVAYEGAEVIIPNWGYPSIANVCKTLKMKPVPVDLKESTLCMDPELIESKITDKTVAIVNTGNNGIIGSDILTIKEIANKHNLMFFEDCAPSLLQEFNGAHAGTFGDVSMFSFSPTKPVICGEGAIVVTDCTNTYEKLKTFRHMTYRSSDANFQCFGDDANEGSLNCVLSPFLAAYVLPQLEESHLTDITESREWIYSMYKERINIFGEEQITNRYGAIMYLSPNAAKISKMLNTFRIEHRYKYYPLYDPELEVSKNVFESIIDLPINYHLTEDQINSICNIVKRVDGLL